MSKPQSLFSPRLSTRLLVLPTLLAGLTYLGRADATCSGCIAPPATASASVPASPPVKAEPAGHPLRGVIVKVMNDREALLVKHEEIPGVMRAMTMVLKVDAATLAAAKTGTAITGTLLKLEDGWWLRDVRSAETTKTKAQ